MYCSRPRGGTGTFIIYCTVHPSGSLQKGRLAGVLCGVIMVVLLGEYGYGVMRRPRAEHAATGVVDEVLVIHRPFAHHGVPGAAFRPANTIASSGNYHHQRQWEQ